MEESLLKFNTEEERDDFEFWFSNYGQYLYAKETNNSIQSVDIDFENHIINIE